MNTSPGSRSTRRARLGIGNAVLVAAFGLASTFVLPATPCFAQAAKPAARNTQPPETQPRATPTAEPAPIAPSGKSLVIPDALKAKGHAYHAQPGGQRHQVTFRSDAPFEKISGHSSGILGFAITGPDNDPAKLQAGEWRLPIDTLKTGDADRDTRLSQAGWFDAAKFPHVLFRLKEVRDVKPWAGAEEPPIRAYNATLVGDLTMHGVTRELTIPDAIIRFRPKSAQSSVLADGDLLFISYKHSILLSDFGVTNAEITTSKKVSDRIEIDLRLLLASVPPEEQPARPAAETPPQPDTTPKAKEDSPKPKR